MKMPHILGTVVILLVAYGVGALYPGPFNSIRSKTGI